MKLVEKPPRVEVKLLYEYFLESRDRIMVEQPLESGPEFDYPLDYELVRYDLEDVNFLKAEDFFWREDFL